MRLSGFAPLCALSLLLAACTPQQQPVAPVERPADFPESRYLQAARQPHIRVYRIESEKSLLAIRTYRSGPLAKLGHDHAIASHNLSGYLSINTQTNNCHGDLYFPVTGLVVDEAQLRNKLALDTRPSASDIAGTRDNMLNLLDAARYPFVEAQVLTCDPQSGTFTLSIALRGVARSLTEHTANLDNSATGMRLNGAFSVQQSDFGITPYSALGGLLQVADAIDISYSVTLERLTI